MLFTAFGEDTQFYEYAISLFSVTDVDTLLYDKKLNESKRN